jgi:TonB family protein
MFHALIESGPRDSIRAQRYVVSVGVHGLAIVAAAMLTRASTGSVRPKPVPIAHPFVLPPAVPAVPAPSRPFPLPRRSNDWQPVVDGPPPALPPVSLGEGLPTVGDLLQRGDFGHGNLGFVAGDSAGAVLPATEVDDPVAVIRQPPPRYPAILAQAGVRGTVRLSYVVDTTGRVEPGSVSTIASSHPAFDEAAREAVLESRFKSAILRGRPVRQLVTQTISFHLRR